ncbi:MAG: hypothetical protein IT198_11490 [Acidimicrobiia bacterium]|nr:hypothetical protein [Acidimicrobiia bacterium]
MDSSSPVRCGVSQGSEPVACPGPSLLTTYQLHQITPANVVYDWYASQLIPKGWDRPSPSEFRKVVENRIHGISITATTERQEADPYRTSRVETFWERVPDGAPATSYFVYYWTGVEGSAGRG